MTNTHQLIRYLVKQGIPSDYYRSTHHQKDLRNIQEGQRLVLLVNPGDFYGTRLELKTIEGWTYLGEDGYRAPWSQRLILTDIGNGPVAFDATSIISAFPSAGATP